MVLSLFYRWGKWRSERLSDLLKVPQPVRGRITIWSQISWELRVQGFCQETTTTSLHSREAVSPLSLPRRYCSETLQVPEAVKKWTKANSKMSSFFFFNKFIYFWLRRVFVAVCRLSLVAESGGYSSLRCMGFSLQWLLLLRSTGLVAPRHVGSSWTRDWTRVPCIGRRILNHCASR